MVERCSATGPPGPPTFSRLTGSWTGFSWERLRDGPPRGHFPLAVAEAPPEERLGINRAMPQERIPDYVTSLRVDQYKHIVGTLRVCRPLRRVRRIFTPTTPAARPTGDKSGPTIPGKNHSRAEDELEWAGHSLMDTRRDVGCGETPTHRLDQIGQAALHADGTTAQPCKARGSRLRTKSRATDLIQKVRRVRCTVKSCRSSSLGLVKRWAAARALRPGQHPDTRHPGVLRTNVLRTPRAAFTLKRSVSVSAVRGRGVTEVLLQQIWL